MEVKAAWDEYSRLSSESDKARKAWRKVRDEFIDLSPYKLEDKVKYVIEGKEDVCIGFIYEISVGTNEQYEYKVSPPKKDGTQSSKPINWIKIEVLRKID